MKIRYFVTLILVLVVAAASCINHGSKEDSSTKNASLTHGQRLQSQQSDTMKYEVVKTEEEWKELLTSGEYRILRTGGTELPFINEYYDNKDEGIYYCGACGQPVFSSETKYKSGTGWPSFWQPIKPEVVGEQEDNLLFMPRTETVCSRCGSHLGHVFQDGPEPTGLRYCLNSQALHFEAMDLSSVDVEQLTAKEIN